MERSEPTLAAGFCSVAVITFALHAKGPQFETGRKQRVAFVLLVLKWLSGDSAQTVTPNELCPVVCGIYADCLSACSAVYVSIFKERAQDKNCGVSVV